MRKLWTLICKMQDMEIGIKGVKMDDVININGQEYKKITQSSARLEDKAKKVTQILGEEFMQALIKADAFIAGGAVLSVFTDKPVNDVDVYFRDKDSMAQAVSELTEDFKNIYNSHTDKSITITDLETDHIVQFIYFDYFKDAQEIFEAFDFSVCMGAVRVKTGELFLSKDFVSDVASRTLHFNNGTRYPYISLLRVKKYEEKCYKIGKGHLLSIVNACANKPITSWAEAKEQLGGIYGYEVGLKLNNREEFTQEAFNEVLTKLEDRDWERVPSGGYDDLLFDLGIEKDEK